MPTSSSTTRLDEEHYIPDHEEETAATSRSCPSTEWAQVDAPADKFADKNEYIDEA